eukprot:GILK01016447.1.p1 GENE.GILK01016447.1~~GILK01016447.1.p1  ORF type:complete len:1208 (+),score=231.04 GILK01016447.1:128-3751(+)
MRLTIFRHEVDFPFQPYPSQIAMMDKMLRSLEGRQHALLESPTGSGKSLALLCSSLAWQARRKQALLQQPEYEEDSASENSDSEDEIQAGSGDEAMDGNNSRSGVKKHKRVKKAPKIYYSSRTHSQINQVVRELRRTSYRPQMSILGSREHYCIHRVVSKKSNKNEECKKLLEHRECLHHRNMSKLSGCSDIKPGGPLEVWDIEELVAKGKELRACPYFGSRELAETAELILCPYNYLVDPIIRRAMNINLKGAVVIMDEAHNIEDTCRDSASNQIDALQLEEARAAFEKVMVHPDFKESHQPFLDIITALQRWLQNACTHLSAQGSFEEEKNVWSGAGAVEMLQEIGITPANFESVVTSFETIATKSAEAEEDETIPKLSAKAVSLLEGLLTVVGFMFSDDMQHVPDYKLAVLKTVSRDANGFAGWTESLALWCMNPAVAFAALSKDCHSIILSSGTLSPLDSFASELGVTFTVKLEANHVIDTARQVWVGTVSQAAAPSRAPLNSSYSKADLFPFQDGMGESLVRYAETIEGGILVFFPSYKLLDKMVARWRATGLWKRLSQIKQLFIEPRLGNDSNQKSNQSKGRNGGGRGKDKDVNALDSVLAQYTEAVKGNGLNMPCGGIFFAVFRGKVSEGLDFADHAGRGVVITGIPFPSLHDPKVRLKRKYLDDAVAAMRNGYSMEDGIQPLGGGQWYQQQASRAVNQAIGRVIRHRYDYGAILLCDERFASPSQVQQLSLWLRPHVRTFDTFGQALLGLTNFFKVVVQSSCVLSRPKQLAERAAAKELTSAASVSALFATPSPEDEANMGGRSSASAFAVNTKSTAPSSRARVEVAYEEEAVSESEYYARQAVLDSIQERVIANSTHSSAPSKSLLNVFGGKKQQPMEVEPSLMDRYEESKTAAGRYAARVNAISNAKFSSFGFASNGSRETSTNRHTNNITNNTNMNTNTVPMTSAVNAPARRIEPQLAPLKLSAKEYYTKVRSTFDDAKFNRFKEILRQWKVALDSNNREAICTLIPQIEDLFAPVVGDMHATLKRQLFVTFETFVPAPHRAFYREQLEARQRPKMSDPNRTTSATEAQGLSRTTTGTLNESTPGRLEYDLVTGLPLPKSKRPKLETASAAPTVSTSTSLPPPNVYPSVSETKSSSVPTRACVCAVCQEPADTILAARCGHICCDTCWDQWLSNCLECPVCKQRTRTTHLTKLFLT